MSARRAEPRGPALPAGEVRAAILRLLHLRDLSPHDLDGLCVERYEKSVHPMKPGTAERALARLLRAETCTLAMADYLFTALGENMLLHLDSYRKIVTKEQGEAGGAMVIDLVEILAGAEQAPARERSAA